MPYIQGMRKRHNTMVDMPIVGGYKTDTEKIHAFGEFLKDSLRNRMGVLRDEAGAISNDMDALIGRLEDEGHLADLADIRSARWYRTASQLLALKQVYSGWCHIMGEEIDAVQMSAQEVESDSDSDDIPKEE